MSNIQFQRGAIDAGACVSGGWELIKANYWMFFGMTTLLVVGSIVISCIPLVGGLLFQIVLAPPLTVGIYYAVLREMDREPTDFGMMFKGFEKMGTAVIVGLIQSIPSIIWTIFSFALNIGSTMVQIIQQQTGRRYGMEFASPNDAAPLIAGGMLVIVLIGAFVMLIFSIAWGITFYFVYPLIADHDMQPMDAIKLSFSAAWSNLGGIVVLFIFEFLICLVGVMALCVGILFVLPIVFAANAIAFRQVFPNIRRNMNFSPPPPNAYGSSFGSGMQ